MVRTGSRAADAAERIPPEDCMMLRLRLALGEAALQGADVALHARSEIRVERDGGAAFVFAEFRKDLVRERDGQAKRVECLRDGLLVRGIGEGEEQRDGDGFGLRFANLAAEFVEAEPVGARRTEPSGPMRSGTPKQRSVMGAGRWWFQS